MKEIMLIVALAASSFIPGSKIEKQVSYYWFNTSGTYLRQNTYTTEFLLTGYDNNPAAPRTLKELGYAPANCTGSNPPVPNDPDSPDMSLYSHP
jgi:hypothetical protein